MLAERERMIVVGAGPAGSALAYGLARAGRAVLLLDQAAFPREKVCGDGLTPRAVAALRTWGLDAVLQEPAYPVTEARLWAGPGLDVRAPFALLGPPMPQQGYVLPRRVLDQRLLNAAQKAGAVFWPQVRVQALCQRAGRVHGVWARVQGRRVCLRAAWVVVATGAAGGLLRSLGLWHRPPHDIRAVRGYWEGVSGLGSAIEFFFLPEIQRGYAWIFPVGPRRANVGLGVYARAGQRVPNLRAWLVRLTREHPALAPRLRSARLVAPPRGYPLRSDFPAQAVAGPGWLAVGEAAGLVNPVTGEGIDLALESARLAAEVLLRTPAAQVPRAYRRALWWHFARSQQGLRALRRVVMRPRPLRALLRAARHHPPLLRRIMTVSLGLASPLTALYPTTWWWLGRGLWHERQVHLQEESA